MPKQSQIAVHLGAHRTGTTLLQKYLYAESETLALHDCHVISTRETRPDLMRHLFDDPTKALSLPDAGASLQAKLCAVLQSARESGQKLIVSEENAIGTMEVNVRKADLYPDLHDKLTVLKPSFQYVDTIYLAMRRLDLWWSSCFSFLIARNFSPPESQLVNRLAAAPRNWADLVSEIKALHPDKKLVVRDCEYLFANPKRQLIKGFGWRFLEDTKRLKLQANSSKSSSRLREILEERGDHAGASRISSEGRYMPFTSEHIDAFAERYSTDCAWMRENLTGDDIFLEAPSS